MSHEHTDTFATKAELIRQIDGLKAICTFYMDHLICIRDFDDNSPWDDPGACAKDALQRCNATKREEVGPEEIEEEALRLFRIVHGKGDSGSDRAFRYLNPAEQEGWMRLAKSVMLLAQVTLDLQAQKERKRRP